MTEMEAEMAIKKWQVEWKQKRDKDRRKSRKEDSDGVFINEGNIFTGCINSTLRQMVDVRSSPQGYVDDENCRGGEPVWCLRKDNAK